MFNYLTFRKKILTLKFKKCNRQIGEKNKFVRLHNGKEGRLEKMPWKKERPAGDGGRSEVVVLDVFVRDGETCEKTTLVLTNEQYAQFEDFFDSFRDSI